MNQRRIQVWETTSLGLILLMPSGILISNQTGGYACLRPEAEGIYVPIQLDAVTLEEFFTGSYWNGSCCNGIDTSTADFIDQFLLTAEHGKLQFLRVDRSRLAESHEAWIYVDGSEPEGDPQTTLIAHFGTTKGILTWQNSD